MTIEVEGEFLNVYVADPWIKNLVNNTKEYSTMRDTMYIQHHARLTEKAKKIFGIAAEEAFVVSDKISELPKESAHFELNNEDATEEEIIYDTSCIAIKFTGGKLVFFNNSEWACIQNETSNPVVLLPTT